MDLFNKEATKPPLLPPLAERMRPTKVKDFVGQEHIMGKGRILSRAIDTKKVFSMILWGPPGSGKTTLAKLTATETKARLRQISACFTNLFAGQPDVLSDYQAFIGRHQREVIEERANTVVGQVVEKLFTLMESATNVTNATNDTLIPISSGDIAEPLDMKPQAVGQILKTLGLQTKQFKIDGSPKRCIVFDQVKLDTIRKRYIPSEDNESVATVPMVTTFRESTQNVTTVDR